MHRHLGKVVAGAAIAVTATAVMVGVTLPSDASGQGKGATAGRDGGPQGSTAEQGRSAGQQPAVVESAPVQGKTGTGRDPLTDDEMKRAEQLALGRNLRDSGENVTGGKGPQRLSTDLAELSPEEAAQADPPRRAEVSYYDYKDDSYVIKTVDLASGKVEHTESQHGIQPPPDRDEAREAARLLIADKLGDGLKRDYKDATGRALTGPDQLTVTGFVYRVDEENAGPAALADCGDHRCVRLFTRVTGGQWIDTRQMVIDLSDRTVHRLG